MPTSVSSAAVCATAAHWFYSGVFRQRQRHYLFDRSLRRLQNGKNRFSEGNAPYERDAHQRVRRNVNRTAKEWCRSDVSSASCAFFGELKYLEARTSTSPALPSFCTLPSFFARAT